MIEYSKIVGLVNTGMFFTFIPLIIIFFEFAWLFAVLMVVVGVLELVILYKADVEEEKKEMLKRRKNYLQKKEVSKNNEK